MVPWQRQLGAVTSLLVLTLGSLPGRAGPPAASGPSPELLAATQVLDRLMAATSIEAPITLIVRPFRGVVCPPQTGDPAARSGPDASSQPTAPSAVCLSGFELPPGPRQGFFVPFVVSLQHEVDPESDPERPSAAVEERTILLNATGLALVRPAAPSGKRQGDEPAPTLPPGATCRIAAELAAVQLNQPQRRRESFDRIHTRLAERVSEAASLARPNQSIEEKIGSGLLLPFMPFLMAAYPISTVEMIHGRNMGHWINARLSESPHWRVLQRDAPLVATALKQLHGMNENRVSQAWGQSDGWFGIAAQEREEVIEAQRSEARAEALRLLAAAGIDPRSCADVFVPASAAEPDAAVMKLYEQARGHRLPSRPNLPRRFLPAEQKVVIYPKHERPSNGNSAPAPRDVPGGMTPRSAVPMVPPWSGQRTRAASAAHDSQAVPRQEPAVHLLPGRRVGEGGGDQSGRGEQAEVEKRREQRVVQGADAPAEGVPCLSPCSSHVRAFPRPV